MMDQPVDHRGGGHVVAEDLAPGPERLVAGDDQRRAFVAAGDEHEHQARGLRVERDIANLVTDQQRDPVQPGKLLVEPALALGVGEEGDPFGRGAEEDALAGEAGADPRARSRCESCRCPASRCRTTHCVDSLPERVRLVAAPGGLRGRELEVLGWTSDDDSGEIALLCRLVDGSAGEIPARWTDLPVRVESQRSVGGVGSPAAWRLLLARGERLAGRRGGTAFGARS